MDRDVALLGRLYRIWWERGSGLDDAGWAWPTRCGDWSVAALYAHVGQGVGGLDALLRRVIAGVAPTDDAASLLHGFHAGASAGPRDAAAEELAGRNASRAAADAGATPAAELVARFGPAAVGALGRVDPCVHLVADYFGHGRVRLADAVLLRVMEATVHLLDLDHALGRPPSAPPEAVDRSLDLLLAVPDRVALLEAATGRTTTPVLPVLS